MVIVNNNCYHLCYHISIFSLTILGKYNTIIALCIIDHNHILEYRLSKSWFKLPHRMFGNHFIRSTAHWHKVRKLLFISQSLYVTYHKTNDPFSWHSLKLFLKYHILCSILFVWAQGLPPGKGTEL